MSRNAFLSEALYEADKALEKLAAAPWSVCVYKMADGADGESQMYVLFCYLHNMRINGLRLCIGLLCRLLHRCKLLSKYAARP